MRNKLFFVFSMLIVASMILSACATPAPQTVIETVVVEKEGQTVIETVVVEVPVEAEEPEAAPVEFTSADPTTFINASFGEAETLDPALDYESAGIQVIQNIYDTLIYYDKEQATEFIPQLALEVPTVENGGISADGKTYTFKIRPGVKFHDGSDMTVEDVAFTFQRGLLQGGTFSPQWLLTEPLLGAGYYDVTDLITPTLAGPDVETLNDDPENLIKVPAEVLAATCEKVKSTIVADAAAGTVTFNLAQPWAPFVPTLANGWGGIMSKAWVGANGGWDGDCATWQNFYGKSSEQINETPIGSSAMGTGPYILDHWTKGEELVLVANENYWRTEPMWEGGPSGAPALKKVIEKNVEEFSTRFAMLQAGDADFAAVGSVADWPQMDTLTSQVCQLEDNNCEVFGEDPAAPLEMITGYPTASRTDFFFTFALDTSGGNNFMGSGMLDGNGIPPNFFSDLNVRLGFAYCFNYDVYLNDVLLGEAIRSHGVMFPGMDGYQEDAPVYEYDPAKCEEYLKASKWIQNADGTYTPDPAGEISLWDTGFRMTIAYNTGNTARQTLAQIFQQELSALNENFIIEVTGLPWPTYLRNQRARKLPLFPVGWIEDIHVTHNWVQPYAIGTYGNRQNLPPELKAQFADLINRAVTEPDAAAREAIYQEFNKTYHEAVTGLILYIVTGRHYQQRWVEGWYGNPIAGTYYYALSKK
ncbi:MAG: ABC transporter substrate-binding protein [Anaerolineales bacterium]|jgi:peptide/nickel transport system substrate-binding protein|nr:ABC transporter substrate-binding protein [Anaerolineales bacterium]